MNMTFNGMLFEDLTQRLQQLSNLLSIRSKSKDKAATLMEQEARIYSFMSCHTLLNKLFVSIFEESELTKKPNANTKNAPGEVLTWMLSQKMVTKEQIAAIAQQYEAARLLTYDGAWLINKEDQQVFKDMVKKIPRYYYGMNTFVLGFSKRLVFYKEKT